VAWDRWGLLPGAIMDQFPNELAVIMFKAPPAKPDDQKPADPVKALKLITDKRAEKFKKPLVPKLGNVFDSLFPGVPNG